MYKQIYKKEYTRDFSIIMEEVWYYANTEGIKQYLNLEMATYPPLIIYSYNGIIELWENKKRYSQIFKEINKKAKANPELFFKIISDYEKKLEYFTKIFKSEKLKSVPELKKFIKEIFKIITPFTIMYYIGKHELGTRELIKKATDLRLNDSFYDDCDKFLRSSILYIYPELKHKETIILYKEIAKLPNKKAINNRLKNLIYIPGLYKKTESLENFVLKNKEYKLDIPKYNFDGKNIMGRTAFKGRARGKVRIILNKYNITNLKKGEILVAAMTTPEYIPAMKKSVAFITDEGGVTCHAAIIAREMKKPCIISTKIATKVLHDGDLVEVDAEKGSVKIIERKQS